MTPRQPWLLSEPSELGDIDSSLASLALVLSLWVCHPNRTWPLVQLVPVLPSNACSPAVRTSPQCMLPRSACPSCPAMAPSVGSSWVRSCVVNTQWWLGAPCLSLLFLVFTESWDPGP